jgi:N-acetylmuramoyl-L-alanine amidase
MHLISKYKKSIPLFLATALVVISIIVYPTAENTTPASPSHPGEEVSASTSPLSGVVVVIDPGHGGYDSGAVGRFTKVLEKDLNLQVSLKLRDVLSQSGAAVIMTREEDVELCEPWTPFGKRKQQDMARRAAIIDEANPDVVLSIHMNEFTISRYYGAQVFYLVNGPEEGKDLAKHMQNALVTGLDNGNTRRQKSGDYFILRIKPASVLIECGFISNEKEEKLLSDDEYQSKLAWCIYSGLTDYLTSIKNE